MAVANTGGTDFNVHGFRVNFLQELGRGGFGTVYKGYSRNNTLVAIKKVSKKNKKKAITEAVRFHYIKETIVHDHVINVYDVKTFEDSMWIIMEYCDLGDLDDFFKNYSQLMMHNEAKVKVMRQITNGIAFLHSKDIVHRDIKPPNILLKLTTEQRVIAKLGDFGLSKILDPNCLTSAMSSNVGSLMFKAPEFWDKDPPDDSGKIKYHRNVDVYSGGLTFVAMLQATPEKSLIPIAEGLAESSDGRTPIGLAAFMNKDAEFNIVNDSAWDSTVTKRLKSIIRGMTQRAPQKRLSASVVKSMFDEMLDAGMFLHTELTPCFSLKVDFLLDTMCFTPKYLLLRSKRFDSISFIFNCYNSETGNFVVSWPVRCKHYLSSDSLMTMKIQDTELLIEGCPHRDCEVIHLYNITTRRTSVGYENVKPSLMCAGPTGTLLVCDIKRHCLLLPTLNNMKFDEMHRLPDIDTKNVHAMCYVKETGLTILSFADTKLVTGITLTTGEVAWQHDHLLTGVPLDPCLCRSTCGSVYLANGDNILVLDSYTGSDIETLLSNLRGISTIVYSDQGEDCKLAVRHADDDDENYVTCYNVNVNVNNDLQLQIP